MRERESREKVFEMVVRSHITGAVTQNTDRGSTSWHRCQYGLFEESYRWGCLFIYMIFARINETRQNGIDYP
jgi:hypothetical protein